MALHPLLDVAELPSVEAYLERAGTVFTAFRDQDSGCVSYGVRLPGGERWFVKEGTTGSACLSLCRAWAFHRAVSHPVIVPQVHRIAVRGNWAVVMPWHEGEVLYHPTAGGAADRTAPGSAMARFRALPLPLVTRAWERILSAHLAVEEAGYVAVDFYDGALLYDFTGNTMRLVDLDEYRPGPFVLEEDRLPGSRRFMAPEEYERGATIDARTTVFTLGRAARLLLDAGDDERAWRGGPARLGVLHRATRAEPGRRFASVRRFAAAWHAAGRA
ncbi:serine/threonine protein kinase [Streptomyces rectiverticillatus]|uniref:serine/threonine protein kinase n=1 Tax=Streptomyces rectiverticillatus TaxID=173860 RepID=UPI0015C33DDF|nr:serine/threonine protein kinase [Streptomyces rectiverticillatus]QLE75574.1 serine/threonine protein kinase [Streptomyces rectiverticillatus]